VVLDVLRDQNASKGIMHWRIMSERETNHRERNKYPSCRNVAQGCQQPGP
jgi:hypothetical protein